MIDPKSLWRGSMHSPLPAEPLSGPHFETSFESEEITACPTRNRD
jgi:hypothetical protein